MASNGKDIDLRINTTADTSGADEAADAIRDVTAAAKDSTDQTAEQADEATAAMGELKDAAKETAEEIKEGGKDAEDALKRVTVATDETATRTKEAAKETEDSQQSAAKAVAAAHEAASQSARKSLDELIAEAREAAAEQGRLAQESTDKTVRLYAEQQRAALEARAAMMEGWKANPETDPYRQMRDGAASVRRELQQTAAENSGSRGFGGMLEAHEKAMASRRDEVEATVAEEKKLADAARQTAEALKEGERASASRAVNYPSGLPDDADSRSAFDSERKANEARMQDLVNQARQQKAEREALDLQSNQRADAMALAARGAAILSVREVAKQARDEVAELNAELVKMGGESSASAEAFVEAMEFITNPLQATTKGIYSLITAGARQAVEDLRASQAQAAAMEARLENLIELRRRQEQEARQSAFTTILASERREIENQTAAMERQMRILRARRELLSAQAELQDQEALEAGEDPNVVAARRIIRKAEEDQAVLSDQLVQAERALEVAKQNQQQATDMLFELKDRGASQEDIERAREALADADNKVSQTAESVRALQTEIEDLGAAVQTRALASLGKTKADIEKAQDDAGGEITKSLEALQKSLGDKAKESGGKLSSTAQAAFDELTKILTDSVPDSQQINEIGRILQLAKSSREGVDMQIINNLTAAMAADQSMLRQLRELQQQQDALRNDLRRLR